MEATTTDAAQAGIDWATNGIGFVMNRYNADPSPKKKANNKTTGPSGELAEQPDESQTKRSE